LMSYRLKGHSVVDPARYRSKEDTDEAKSNDPVPAFRAKLIADGVLTQEDAEAIDQAAEDTVTAAVAFADESPDPAVDGLFDKGYASEVPNMPRRLPADPVVVLS